MFKNFFLLSHPHPSCIPSHLLTVSSVMPSLDNTALIKSPNPPVFDRVQNPQRSTSPSVHCTPFGNLTCDEHEGFWHLHLPAIFDGIKRFVIKLQHP